MANEVIPGDADNPMVLHGLVRKRAEIAGQMDAHQAELRRLTVELEHIDAAILIFNPRIDIRAIRTKQPPAPHASRRGEITQHVFSAIREAKGRPVTAQEIVAGVMASRGFDPSDKKLRKLMLGRVRVCLRMHGASGIIERAGMVEGRQGWVAVPR